MARRDDEFAGTSDEPIGDGGDTLGGDVIIDPATLGDGGGPDDTVYDPDRHTSDRRKADGTFRVRKSRGSGGGSRPRAKAYSKDDLKSAVEGLSTALLLIHAGIAAVGKVPEMELSEGEAQSLARATASLMDEMEIRPNPVVTKTITLITVAGTVYGPRIYLIGERRKEERKERAKQPGNISTFPGYTGNI